MPINAISTALRLAYYEGEISRRIDCGLTARKGDNPTPYGSSILHDTENPWSPQRTHPQKPTVTIGDSNAQNSSVMCAIEIIIKRWSSLPTYLKQSIESMVKGATKEREQ